ncbi:MAG TPA: ABC transporter ATP-binding protein [Planctomycetaceae bacterium]|nr:ABC transporter ATP-binding protein [Planctomycetaceae bacterium]
MSTVFEFQNVTKRFGSFIALDDVSFTGKPGQVIALLGENGAGKTTTIKILLGLLDPDIGAARVMSMVSRLDGAEIRRRVGYVPDRPALYDWMTVQEAGWFAAGFYPLGYQEKYLQLVRQYQLPLDRQVKSLSKGMQSKVSLAVALAHEPQLLVLDEPTSGLDPLVRREFLESMVDVAATGRTVLLSSHQIVEVERVADTVMVLRKGKLVLNERLEVLKSRVREVLVTQDAVDTIAPELPRGAILLGAKRDDRQWQLLVRDLPDDSLSWWQSRPNCVDATIRQPSLEEIFVVCMQTETTDSWTFPEGMLSKTQEAVR